MLESKLKELFRLVAAADPPPPIPKSIVIAELRQLDEQGRPLLRASDLVTVSEYTSRFDALLAKCLPWINLSYYGVLDGRGLVVVELPNDSRPRPSGVTSINFSGPPAIAASAGWDARVYVVIE